MDKDLREKLPTWYEDLKGKDAILTGDIDSFFSCKLLEHKFGCKIRGFYDFKSTYFVSGGKKNLFGVDMDTIDGTVFGNHITYFHSNPNAINPNNCYNLKYYQKYPFSTALLIISLYNLDLRGCTDEQLRIILAIDSAYKGYYTSNTFFQNVYLTWLDRLDIRFLEDRILKNMSISEFGNIQRKYKLNGTIWVDEEGYLRTNIDLDKISEVFNTKMELPKDKFYHSKDYEYVVIDPNRQSIPDRDKIFSMAWTLKNEVKMSLKV